MIHFRNIFLTGCLLLATLTSPSTAMECLFKKEDGIIGMAQEVLNQCPPLIGGQDKKFCCMDTKLNPYCCDLPNFVLNVSLWLIPIIIIVLVASSIVSCICCLCCPCCFIYKRRHGRVYHTEPASISSNTTTAVSSPNYQPVHQIQYQPTPFQQLTTTSTKMHLPPGAYPVYPQFTDSPKHEANRLLQQNTNSRR